MSGPRRSGAWRRLGWSLLGLGLLGCSSAPAGGARSPIRDEDAPLHFRFSAPDGEVLDAEALRGRATLILLITTFDLASHLMARQARDLLHTFSPRINVGAVLLEAPRYAELKGTFQQTLGLDFPVVMADHASLAGRGPFGEIVHVPTTIVLDRQGREQQRILGPASREELERALRAAL